VVASVAFQYGDLSRRTPNFWRQVTSGDWDAALNNLRHFGDKYPTRRNKEADLLAKDL
jgi:GH24 family phage-related lysozyme (muramidase)